MIRTIRERVTIQPGGMIEIHNSELPAGAQAEVVIMVQPPAAGRRLGLPWRGALREERLEHTSVELQHKLLDGWGK